MPQPPTEPAPPDPGDPAQAAVRARAEDLLATCEAAYAECLLIIGSDGSEHLVITTELLDAKEELVEYVFDHREELADLGWANEIYETYQEALLRQAARQFVDARMTQILKEAGVPESWIQDQNGPSLIPHTGTPHPRGPADIENIGQQNDGSGLGDDSPPDLGDVGL